jgi:predicted dehydrogenase
MEKKPETAGAARTSRRTFLSGAVASAALLPPSAHAARTKPIPKVTGRVLGANDRINVGFVGCGMQFLGLLQRGFNPRKEKKGDFEFAALCDVWEPRVRNGVEKTKAPKTYRDFRELFARPDIDGVVLAVPDHWHYPMARAALLAGKDVYLEKPMTYTVDEAARLCDLVGQTQRVLQVGGSGPSTRLYWQINDSIKAGKIGKVLWGLISYNRNTRTGMWDYPIPGVGDEHWPGAEVSDKNLDWKMWLGSAPKRPFNADRYFRWRKYWDYSGGNATDLLYHRLGMMSTMIGFDFPTRVTAAGGIYVQKDREVPDTYMTTVEYPGDYAVNMISCMANVESAPVTVYGNWATVQVLQERPPAGAGRRARPVNYALIKAERDFLDEFKNANGGKEEVRIDAEESQDLVDNWLECMRSREKPVYDVLRGYQIMVAIGLGVESYREGRVMAFDPTPRRVLSRPPARKSYLTAETT